MKPDIVREYCERFRTAPFGVWSTCETAPREQIIRFFPNQRGICTIAPRLGGQTIHFEWRTHEDFCLLIRQIDPNSGTHDEDTEWLFLRYEFLRIRTSDGKRVVMRMLEFGRLKSFDEPLFFHGNADPARALAESPDEEPPPKRESVGEQMHGRGLLALFCTGMLIGIALLVVQEMQVAVEPIVYCIVGGVLFVTFYLLFSAIGSGKAKPKPNEDYIHDEH